MPKKHMKYSRASGSERAKLRKLEQRGWKQGDCRVGDALRSPKRQRNVYEVVK